MKAAQFCKDVLLKHVINDNDFIDDPCKALKNAFFKTDSEFAESTKATILTDGTTAVAAAIHGQHIYVANAGDRYVPVPQLYTILIRLLYHKLIYTFLKYLLSVQSYHLIYII